MCIKQVEPIYMKCKICKKILGKEAYILGLDNIQMCSWGCIFIDHNNKIKQLEKKCKKIK
jgi:hypothetical protein